MSIGLIIWVTCLKVLFAMKKKSPFYFEVKRACAALCLGLMACEVPDSARSSLSSVFVGVKPALGETESDRRPLISVGLSADYPPFEFKSEGQIMGFDVDLAEALAKQLGYRLDILDMDFSSLVPALQAHRVDWVLSGMTITEERKKNLAFSQIYYRSSVALITAQDRQGLLQEASTTPRGQKIGAQLGSTLEAYGKQLSAQLHGLQIVALARYPILIQELKSGRLDGLLAEEIQAASFVQSNPGLTYRVLGRSEEGYAVALAKTEAGAEASLTAVNQALQQLQKVGVIQQLEVKWLHHPPSLASSGRMLKNFQFIALGMLTTLKYTVIAAIGGLILGLGLALMKVGEWTLGRWMAEFYTSLFRGTPMLVQLSLVYFGAPSLLHYKISPMVAGVIAFSLNSAAYVSEIIRTGIKSVDRSQYEAAHVLDVPYFKMMQAIILPQAFRNVLPALMNEVVNLLKETALVSTLGEEDIMRRAQVVAAETYSYFEPLLMAAGCYYLLVSLLNFCVKRLEVSLAQEKHL